MRYGLPMTCLSCGGEIVHRCSGATNGVMTRAIGDCSVCGLEHRITVVLQVVDHNEEIRRLRPNEVACGTNRMYQRGCRCSHCTAAHTAAAKPKNLVRAGP